MVQDEPRTNGLAIAMPANNFPAPKVEAGFNTDYMWRNRSFHLSAKDAVEHAGQPHINGPSGTSPSDDGSEPIRRQRLVLIPPSYRDYLFLIL